MTKYAINVRYVVVHLEAGVAAWANEEIERLSGGDAIMFEPTEAYRKEGLGVASSIDRIIELSEP